MTKLITMITFLVTSLSLQALEIDFKSPIDCENSFRHHSYCFATKPQEWSDKDKARIKEVISEWPEHAQMVVPKKIQLFRMSYGYTPRSAFSNMRKKDVYAWIEKPNKVYVTDHFIKTKKIIEGGTYSFNSYTMLHEMVHLFDRKISSQSNFLNLYNWIQIEEPNSINRYITKKWVMADIDQNELEAKRAELGRLMQEGTPGEAAQRSLQFAAQYGLPTMYSTVNPKECFAELVTNFILAPELNSQLKPEALNYLQGLFNH